MDTAPSREVVAHEVGGSELGERGSSPHPLLLGCLFKEGELPGMLRRNELFCGGVPLGALLGSSKGGKGGNGRGGDHCDLSED